MFHFSHDAELAAFYFLNNHRDLGVFDVITEFLSNAGLNSVWHKSTGLNFPDEWHRDFAVHPYWNPLGYLWFVKYVEDRKSTRLNSSHRTISYAVFCLKKKR